MTDFRLSLSICVCVPAAVAHVHGGLQWSECAGSRKSQLLKDNPRLRQRDKGGVCQSDTGDSSTCNTNTLSRVPRLNNLFRPNIGSWRFDSVNDVLRNNRMYVDQKCRRAKAWLCFLSPAWTQCSAGLLISFFYFFYFPLKLIITVIVILLFFFFPQSWRYFPSHVICPRIYDVSISCVMLLDPAFGCNVILTKKKCLW